MFNVIGRCTIDNNRIKNEMPKIIYSELRVERKYWPHISSLCENVPFIQENYRIISAVYDRTFPNVNFYMLSNEERSEAYEKAFNKVFDKWMDDIVENNYVIKCYYIDDMIAIVGVSENINSMLILPSEFVAVEEYKNYDSLNGYERKMLSTGKTTTTTDTSISSIGNKTKNQVTTEKEAAEAQKRNLEAKIEDVKNANSGKLAEMQAHIDKLQKELENEKQKQLNILNQKKAEMEEQLEKLEMTIFKLDSEIYAIRCYTGEVVELKQLRSGKTANEDTPLVFYQKLRYLDEELGKYVSLYDVDYTDINSFETLLKSREDMLKVFAPSERSLMLVIVSKTGLSYTNNDVNYNMLETYEKYHGKKIAIVLRDGENLYIAWTDDERIVFSNEAFYKPGEHEVTEEEKEDFERKYYETDEEYKKRIKETRKKNINEMLGRYFVATIMQGLIDKNFIKFPEKVKFENSPYIIRSYADGWIISNQYGELEDMIKRCNSFIQKGDKILTMQSLRANRSKNFFTTYQNDRGRGEKNRTHDVEAKDCTIYPINYIEHSADYQFEYYDTDENGNIDENNTYTRNVTLTDEEVKQWWEHPRRKGFTVFPDTDSYRFFISLKKLWSYEEARANFEVYEDEFINLTYMNSVWLEYIINNHKTHNISIGGEKVDFAHLLPYLKTALQFVRERETKVVEYIKNVDASVLKDEEWPVKLSEWMLDNDIHNFSEYRTKQFIKHIKEY